MFKTQNEISFDYNGIADLDQYFNNCNLRVSFQSHHGFALVQNRRNDNNKITEKDNVMRNSRVSEGKSCNNKLFLKARRCKFGTQRRISKLHAFKDVLI